MTGEDKTVVFFLALGGVSVYGAFLPPVSEVAVNYQTPDEKAVLREAECIASGLLLAVAMFTAYLANTGWPFILAIVISAAMFGTYEYALARVAVDKAV